MALSPFQSLPWATSSYKKASFNDWAIVIDKLHVRLESWKSRYLSLGSRLTLLNAILSAIPTYYLSVLHLPIRVEKEIDKIRKRFLWKLGREDNQGYHLINWNRICRHRDQNRLGILNIRSFNTALKCKLLWNLIYEIGNVGNKKWYRLIRSRYCITKIFGSLLNSSPGTLPLSGRN